MSCIPVKNPNHVCTDIFKNSKDLKDFCKKIGKDSNTCGTAEEIINDQGKKIMSSSCCVWKEDPPLTVLAPLIVVAVIITIILMITFMTNKKKKTKRRK